MYFLRIKVKTIDLVFWSPVNIPDQSAEVEMKLAVNTELTCVTPTPSRFHSCAVNLTRISNKKLVSSPIGPIAHTNAFKCTRIVKKCAVAPKWLKCPIFLNIYNDHVAHTQDRSWNARQAFQERLSLAARQGAYRVQVGNYHISGDHNGLPIISISTPHDHGADKKATIFVWCVQTTGGSYSRTLIKLAEGRFGFIDPKIWNRLPVTIRHATSLRASNSY